MIRDISIQNFRCFENTSISGFKTVNLITGKNNAGKTALLEALLLTSSPRPSTIASLKGYRHESEEFDKTLPERAWDNMFFNQDNSKKISIQSSEYTNQSCKLFISIDDDNSIQHFKELDKSSDNYVRYADLLSARTSRLKINIIIGDTDNFSTNLIATKQGIVGTNSILPEDKIIPFIPSSFIVSNVQIADEYDKARLNYREKEVLKGLQIVDSSIELVEYFGIGSPMIYLTRKNEKRLPLSLFGDAINRVAAIILSIINNSSNILLVDEIENGIHYASQTSLWRMLFRLAKELNVQIFATTHSLEMLKAFTEVGLENEFSSLASHFEMARSVKTGQIIGIKRDMETLEYSLSHGGGVRGE
jgi:AAA15 family ATPase/GTPase